MTTPSSLAEQITNTPSGPGGVHGLGDTFAADLHTGTGRFTIPIALPKGHAGTGPSLALVYSSGAGAGVAGAGWSFGVPSVRRRTDKGLPSYTEDDVFVLGDDELLPVGDRRYVRRQEGAFAKIHQVVEGGGTLWAVHTRKGGRQLYGRTAAARGGASGRTATWWLSETTDPHGNTVTYHYDRDLEGRRSYLEAIEWGDGAWRVEIAYEARPDVLRNARAGFEEITRRRLASITLQVRSSGGSWASYEQYRFGYLQSSVSGLSLLHEVQRTGLDGGEVLTWPVLRLDYTGGSVRLRQTALTGAPHRTLSDANLQLVDLDGNALPDLLLTEGDGFAVARNDGQGGFRPFRQISGPRRVRLRDQGVFLADFDGKGFSDLVTPEGLYPNEGDGFGTFRLFGDRPTLDFEDPNVVVSDVTGDGLPDLLEIRDSRIRVYRQHPSGWSFEAEHVVPDERFPPLSSAWARMVDLTGDGLQDRVMVHRHTVEVWGSLGGGRFSRRRELALPVQLPASVTPGDLQLVDVTGSGAADLVVRVGSQVWIYPNGSGAVFGSPIRLSVHAGCALEKLTVVDLFATGVRGLLFSSDRGGWTFYALWDGVKPDGLLQIDNGLGSTTEVRYGSSARHALRDRERGRAWRYPLPYAVQVVDEIRVVDSTTGFEQGTRYRYHEGYHDGEDREYRGFGVVEQLDTASLRGDPKSVSSARVVQFFSLGNGSRFPEWSTPQAMAFEPDRLPAHRDARRALRGHLLRTETFGEDGSPAANRPYTVEHASWEVRCVRRPTEDRPGSYYAVVRVSDALHLERSLEVRHLRTTTVHDRYARPVEQRVVAYGRPNAGAAPLQQQQAQTLERVTRTRYLTLEEDAPEAGYAEPYTPFFLLDAPHETSTYGVDDGVETLLAQTLVFYDGPDFEGLGYPGSGTEPALVRGRKSCQLVRRGTKDTYVSVLPQEGFDALTGQAEILLHGGVYWAHGERIAYDDRGQPVASKAPTGGVTTLTYDATFGLFPIESTDPLGHPSTVVRSPDLPFRIDAMEDANGNVIGLTYDARHLLLTKSVQGKEVSPGVWSGDPPSAPTEQITYDLDARPVQITVTTRQERGGATLTVHRYLDGQGRTLQEAHQAEDAQWRITGWQVLDAKGNVVEAFQPFFRSDPTYQAGDTTVASIRTAYDPLSRPVRVTHPDGTFESVVHRPWSTEARDRNDNAVASGAAQDSRYTSSEAEWSRHAETPTTTHHDALGRTIAVTEHNGFDASGEPIFHTTRSVLNLRDEVVEVWDARDLGYASWTFAFDDAGQPLLAESHTGAGLRQTVMDGAGQPVWSQDARGVVIERTFDLLGRPLTEHSLEGGVQKLRRTWSYAVYRDADHESHQATNRYGPPMETRDADGLRLFTYDHRGLVLTVEARFWDHIWTKSTAAMWTEGEAWDPEIDASPRESLSWMPLSGLPGSPSSVTTSTVYDAAGRPVQVTYPGGLTVVSSYNAAGALESLTLEEAGVSTPIVQDYRYDARGKVLGWTLGNGVVTEKTYDADLERLLRVFSRVPSGSVFQDLTYAYDPAGNLVEIDDQLENPGYANNQVIPAGRRTFSYDSRYRLIRATGRKLMTVGTSTLNPYAPSPSAGDYEAYDFTYSHDAVGNLTRNDEVGGAVHYQQSPGTVDRYAGTTSEASSATNYVYDANGNTTHTPRHQSIGYSFDSQPRFVDMGGGGRVHDLRNGDQRCVRFGDKSAYQTLSIRLGPWTYLERTGPNARAKVELQIGTVERHAQVERVLSGTDSTSTPLYYVLGDHLGSGHVLTSDTGQLLSQEEYLPYGRSADRRDQRNRYRFLGVERDEQTDLVMTGPRTYDPLTGRFLQSDPLVQPGKGPYVYASGNPVGRLDPGGYADAPAAPEEPSGSTDKATAAAEGAKASFDYDPPSELLQLIEEVGRAVPTDEYIESFEKELKQRGVILRQGRQGRDIVEAGKLLVAGPAYTYESDVTFGTTEHVSKSSDGSFSGAGVHLPYPARMGKIPKGEVVITIHSHPMAASRTPEIPSGPDFKFLRSHPGHTVVYVVVGGIGEDRVDGEAIKFTMVVRGPIRAGFEDIARRESRIFSTTPGTIDDMTSKVNRVFRNGEADVAVFSGAIQGETVTYRWHR